MTSADGVKLTSLADNFSALRATLRAAGHQRGRPDLKYTTCAAAPATGRRGKNKACGGPPPRAGGGNMEIGAGARRGPSRGLGRLRGTGGARGSGRVRGTAAPGGGGGGGGVERQLAVDDGVGHPSSSSAVATSRTIDTRFASLESRGPQPDPPPPPPPPPGAAAAASAASSSPAPLRRSAMPASYVDGSLSLRSSVAPARRRAGSRRPRRRARRRPRAPPPQSTGGTAPPLTPRHAAARRRLLRLPLVPRRRRRPGRLGGGAGCEPRRGTRGDIPPSHSLARMSGSSASGSAAGPTRRRACPSPRWRSRGPRRGGEAVLRDDGEASALPAAATCEGSGGRGERGRGGRRRGREGGVLMNGGGRAPGRGASPTASRTISPPTTRRRRPRRRTLAAMWSGAPRARRT